VITSQDHEAYGSDLVDFSKRAAIDAVGPALQQLRQENNNLRSMAQRSQRADIERALDNSGIDWCSTYANPAVRSMAFRS
jgi:hypothetical protein